jgi:hypothetical protein
LTWRWYKKRAYEVYEKSKREREKHRKREKEKKIELGNSEEKTNRRNI